MEAISFALFAKPGRAEQETLLFVKSLRQFGGAYKNAPVWVMTLENDPLSKDTVNQLETYQVQLQSVKLAQELITFPFAAKSIIAGIAETYIKETSPLMVWLDRDSLVIQEPNDLILPSGKTLGYRPVDHKNIGSPYEEPLDDFWKTLYQNIQVSPDKIFPILTSVDQIFLRPYINAGMLVVRPEVGLLSLWADAFKKFYQHPQFTPFYKKHPLYRIFIHQAILSAVLTRVLPFEKWFELPYQINYPLHMHKNYPIQKKPKNIHEVVTCRCDTFFEDKNWQEQISLSDPFGSWLLYNILPLLDSITKVEK